MTAAAWASLGFFLPFSSAGVSLSLAALALLAVPRIGALWRTAPWKEPVTACGLLLFIFIVGHTLWLNGASRVAASAINNYHELLLAPLLLALLLHAPAHRQVLLRGLMAGATLLAVAQWIAVAVPSLAPSLESRRISAGFALALVSFLVLMRAQGTARPWPARGLAAFLALTVLFAIEGRTGHVVLLVLAACAAWSHSLPRWRWGAAFACPLLVLAIALASPAVRVRIHESVAASGPPVAANALTSTGIRVELLRLADSLARSHWPAGVGFANYADAHAQAASSLYSGRPVLQDYLAQPWIRITNPHNEYLMQLIGGGAAALALFLAWLALALRTAWRSPARHSAMLAGTTLAFAVGCLFNAMLMNFMEGHLYMALLACLLAESRQPSKAATGAEMQRILVIATRQIGDVLLTTPLIHAARARWPHAQIDVLGVEGTLGMLRGNPDVNELVAAPPRLGDSGLTFLRGLWRRYDLALVTDVGDRAHLMGWIAAPMRSGIVPDSGSSNWWKKALLDHVLTAAGDRGERHVTVEKQSLLDPWGAGAGATEVIAPAPAPLPTDVQSQLSPGAVVIHAPSMWPYKQWPLAHFEELVSALLAEGRQVILTGSNSARDQECVAPLRDLGKPPALLDLSGRLDFNQLVTLFRAAALYIGPDTSVSHLAAAAGVPVIGIFGPTNPMRWGPWPARPRAQQLFERSVAVQQAGNVTLLQSGLPCVPCGRAGCEDHRQSRSDCLVDITPQRVLEQALRLLGER